MEIVAAALVALAQIHASVVVLNEVDAGLTVQNNFLIEMGQ